MNTSYIFCIYVYKNLGLYITSGLFQESIEDVLENHAVKFGPTAYRLLFRFTRVTFQFGKTDYCMTKDQKVVISLVVESLPFSQVGTQTRVILFSVSILPVIRYSISHA